MTNELTHALFAGAVMAVINPFLGLEVIGWNVFLAGLVGMLLNLDRIEMTKGKRSPIGHSLGFALVWLYVVACIAYVYCMITGASLIIAGIITLAVGVGLFSHLLLDAVSGQQIFTFPNNMKFKSWITQMDTGFDRFWGAWNRTKTSGIKVRDSQVNIFSLATLLLVIAVF